MEEFIKFKQNRIDHKTSSLLQECCEAAPYFMLLVEVLSMYLSNLQAYQAYCALGCIKFRGFQLRSFVVSSSLRHVVLCNSANGLTNFTLPILLSFWIQCPITKCYYNRGCCLPSLVFPHISQKSHETEKRKEGQMYFRGGIKKCVSFKRATVCGLVN